MQLGIIGLPQAGKQTIFSALTGTAYQVAKKGEHQIATIDVPDSRVDFLSDLYNPAKTTYAKVQYLLPHLPARPDGGRMPDAALSHVRTSDALIHVVRNFELPGLPAPDPARDFKALDEELCFADLVVVEKRSERLAADKKRGKKPDPGEEALLSACQAMLEQGRPLRHDPALANAPQLKGFTLLSAKPTLVVINNPDEDESPPRGKGAWEKERFVVVRGKLEEELAQMTGEEAEVFLAEYGVADRAMDRMIHESYALLGMISFFTVGEDEVRAWTIPRGTPAVEAAGAIHTDLQKGFIRAEVVAYQDLKNAGGFQEAKKQGK
ncbi:MAG: redox-regulated ATPase YchF, partial [Deltaproteobacteria bacterium]|nr:redox-regulated ATPase YchF [Deltaproteobacteria bacterium]